MLSYSYDAVGYRTGQTDGNNHTTVYADHVLDRLAGITDPLNHTTTFNYDANGNRLPG